MDEPNVKPPDDSPPPEALKNRKPTLVLMALLLAAILTGAIYYRLGHPFLTVSREGERAAAPSGEAKEQEHGTTTARDPKAMQDIMELMQRLQSDPRDIATLSTLSSRFMEMEAWDQARGLLTKLLVVEPSNTDALRMLGISLFELEEYAGSAQTFETILALGKRDAEAHFNLGILYARFLEQPAKGKGHLQAVLELSEASQEAKTMSRHALEEMFDTK